MKNDFTILIKNCKGLLHSVKYCSCNKVVKNSKDCLECDYNMDKKCTDAIYIPLDKRIIDFDNFKDNYMKRVGISNPIGSVDSLYIHDNSCISFVEFKLGAKAPNAKNNREQVFSSIEILSHNVIVDNCHDFLKNNVNLYLIFSRNVFNIDKMKISNEKLEITEQEFVGECENKLYMSFAYLSNDLVRYSGLEYFQKLVLNDVKVMFDDEFLPFINNNKWDSSTMQLLE